ncbi:spore cortex-lytic enzyme [Bacillus sonorensis]|uniref:spore cortex-lytic enzyme n=1 Tax=Bacillus sonorensis TaxID=119858 RepID=UPI00227DB63C|nr:spore cortex-lytic enzyme [Bacillus sonorensis]MCZ0067709.1 spore cortex-lytic enzyme [Bacillus sonorensis]MCZ0096239.1 spore cortex-lytic enzyme [Bacillus sonorensis]MEC1355693.1 spore cortex-lytic enzyme [Bacillus sonorensis]MEC1425903.1 spore cortex-lytic enzyme [Bacillus sonorensis]MEC1516631.1 spore cortex-lytic enzyme [Bacillus sonorensis]
MKSKGSFCLNVILCTLMATSLSLPFSQTSSAFTAQVIQRGATGDDVIELQARLQYNGYYNGKIDGVYGWATYWAVRNFQHRFGLKETDGLVGPKTKQHLVNTTKYYSAYVHKQLRKGNQFTHYGGMPLKYQTKPSKEVQQQARQRAEARQRQQAAPKQYAAQKQQQKQQAAPKQPEKQAAPRKYDAVAANMPGGFSNNDINLLAQAVYGEARGEPYDGQVAVAAVILNRIDSPIFPNTVAGVIFEPLAFTAVADGQIYMTPDKTAKKAVLDAINGWDPSENALYYFNPDTATSPWIWGRPQIKRIGKHIFCE